MEDVFTPAQRKEIIASLTDAIVKIEGEKIRPVTWVIIEDVRSGAWGIGGEVMTTDAVQALALARDRHRPLLPHGARDPFAFQH